MLSALRHGQVLTADVVVAGGGLGGVSAALYAAERGKKVILVEAGPYLGGTVLFSGGGIHIWSATSWEEYQRFVPLADPVLVRALFDNFAPYVAWLRATGAPGRYERSTTRGLTLEKYQIGNNVMPPGKRRFFDALGRRIAEFGGTVLLGTRAIRLMTTGGRVTELVAEHAGATLTIQASKVILATGGFQSNLALLDRYVSPASSEFVTRAVSQVQGEGLSMALAVGAAESPSMDTIYGHLMPAPPARIGWTNYLDPLVMSVFYAEHGIVVNAHGERFVDEGEGELSGRTINAAAKQPPGGLWTIIDDRIQRTIARYELPTGALHPRSLRYPEFLRYLGVRREGRSIKAVINSLQLARDRGAIVLTAPTLDALATQLAGHAVDAQRFLDTVSEFNATVSGDAALGIAVPKTKHAHKLEVPPFHAIKVAVGVSMTYGGIAINEHAQVLNRAGIPIDGLFAVPGTAGGVQHLTYGGALAACGVYGMIAGMSVSNG